MLNSVLSEKNIKVEICSMAKRDNVQLIADRYPIAGPSLCSEFNDKNFDTMVVVDIRNNRAVLDFSFWNPASR